MQLKSFSALTSNMSLLFLIFFILNINYNFNIYVYANELNNNNFNNSDNVSEKLKQFDYTYIKKIPILHEGRIKPLDTFARIHLLGFYGKDSLPEISAIMWLTELLLDQDNSDLRKIFDIRHPDLRSLLQLEERKKHKYSYNEIATKLNENNENISYLHQMPDESLSLAQKELLSLYYKIIRYNEIKSSLYLIIPKFEIKSSAVAEFLEVKANKSYSYLDLIRKEKSIYNIISQVLSDKEKKEIIAEEKKEIIHFAFSFDHIASQVSSDLLKIIPPQWIYNKTDHENEWLTPWTTIELGKGSPNTAEYFQLWENLYYVYNNFNQPNNYKENDKNKNKDKNKDKLHQDKLYKDSQWNKISQNIFTFFPHTFSASKINAEVLYNELNLFNKSLVFYLISFLLLALSWLMWTRWLWRISFSFLIAGFIFHLIGVILRIYIMERPPVATLYESIIFVGLTSVFCAIFLEIIKKNSLGVLIGSISGITLHFIGLSYASDGDTMGMLVAVLNTKFWLATHVITISIGYACCLVGGIIGHIYLIKYLTIKKLPNPQNRSQNELLESLYKSMIGIALFALFFSLLGTILGGIWADQSWGRFWGWDPKENGALLICLWLIWIIHGRLNNLIGQIGFAIGMVINIIIVVLAWFGVNLLNVGLHSYGNTGNVALNVIIFCLLESLFVILMYIFIKIKSAKSIA